MCYNLKLTPIIMFLYMHSNLLIFSHVLRFFALACRDSTNLFLHTLLNENLKYVL